MPIADMVKENRFRQDLLYRINTIEIHIPPLRGRLDDIPLLANHFLEGYSKKYKKNVRTISEAALKVMQKYNWPGNVRELQHAIERAVIMCNSQVLNPR
jgi:two-component system response regulator HydG